MPGGTLTRAEFAASIKAKYPVYASVPDAELVDKMLAKYPVYQDQVVDFKSTATLPPEPSRMARVGELAGDVLTGAAKGAGQTAANLGSFIHMIPGVSRGIDALYGAPVSQPSFTAADELLAPTNTAQSIGKGAEQLAEFFVPGGAVSRASQGMGLAGRLGLEAAVGGGVAAAQGASLPEVAESGALSAIPGAIPVKRLRASIAEHLSAKAAKRVTEGLGATTKRLKNEAQKIAPEFAKRGLGGSIESLAEQSASQAGDLGREIGATIKGPIGQQTRPTGPIVAAIEKAKGKLTTRRVGGRVASEPRQPATLPQLAAPHYLDVPIDLVPLKTRYITENSQEAARALAGKFSQRQERQVFVDGLRKEYGDTLTVYRVGNIAPGTIQSYSLDPKRLAYFARVRGSEPVAYSVKAKDIAFPGLADDLEVAIDSAKVVKGAVDDLIVTDKPQWDALSKLQDVVQEYGDEMSVAQINALKRIYAKVTTRSGGYNEKAGEILNTAPEAAKTFAAILRREENGVEALAKLNKEFGFWKSLNNVTRATVERRSSQGRGLTASLAPVIGAVGGGASGDGVADRVQNAIIGGLAGRKLTTALQSPQWKFVRARYASHLAEALAGSNPERIGQVVGKILAAEAAHAN